MFFVYIFAEKRCKNTLGVVPVCFLAFQTLKILRTAFYMDPEETVKKSRWEYFMKNNVSRYLTFCKKFKKKKVKPGAF